MTTQYDYTEAKAKWDRLQELINHTPECGPRPTEPPYTDDNHDHNLTHLRDALIWHGNDDFVTDDDDITPRADGPEILHLVRYLFAIADSQTWKPYRDELSQLALSMSLCPMHMVDYAICFDEEDPDCEQIRSIFPGHDT